MLSDELAHQWLRVCYLIDLTVSRHYDLTAVKLLDWILQMLQERPPKSVGCESSCTTLLPVQQLASRPYEIMLSSDRTERRALTGTTLTLRCLTIVYMCCLTDTPSLLEQPKLSKIAWLSAWKWLRLLGLEEAVVASCMLGSIHQEELPFLIYGFDARSFQERCSGGHAHMRVEGAYTKQSAIYVPGVVKQLARHIVSVPGTAFCQEEPARKGLGSGVVNDLLKAGKWSTIFTWSWQTPSQLDVLVSHAYMGLLHRLAQRGGGKKSVASQDNPSAEGAHAKGRSSAPSLRRSLEKACAVTVAANLHPALGVAPTGLSTANAPSRDRNLLTSSDVSILEFLSDAQVVTLHSHQFSRPAAGWLRLYILVAFALCPGAEAWPNLGVLHHDSLTELFALSSQLLTTILSGISSCLWISIDFGLACLFWIFVGLSCLHRLHQGALKTGLEPRRVKAGVCRPTES